MKARHFIIPVIALLAACQQMELETELPIIEENTEESEPADSVTVWSFTLQANKGEGETKALDLINEGATLNAYWKNTEKVKVYKGGTLLGTLDVTPGAGEKPTKATLSGSITTAGLAPGDILTLRTPGESWNYTGQVGTLASIETDFDHANASVIIGSVDELNHTITTTGTASFQNQQSIYRFGFKLSGTALSVKQFSVIAASNLLVRQRTWNGSDWASTPGSITVISPSATSELLWASLRNEKAGTSTDDTYSFTVIGSDNAAYLGEKAIPATVLDKQGRFISAKSVSVSKVVMSKSSQTLTEAW